jgi:uncharacterized membrane protein YbhN (UPF0104 family)
MKSILPRLKPFLRWVILGGTLFFLATALKHHWQDVLAIRITPSGWMYLAIALGVTLLAHIWTGWVWGWILQDLAQVTSGRWSVVVYLKTNIAKYLPGNVWHFYGRVWMANQSGIPWAIAAISVVLEPLLMAASALEIALISYPQGNGLLQAGCLGLLLLSLNPRFLNPLLGLAQRLKGKPKPPPQAQLPTFDPTLEKSQEPQEQSSTIRLTRYPLRPLLGELGFLMLRSAGFLLTVLALQPLELGQIPILVSAFSIAWLLGLIVPGAPGGLGVFEATAIALLSPVSSTIPPGTVLSAVALYRLISILAEASGAGLAYLDRGTEIPSVLKS